MKAKRMHQAVWIILILIAAVVILFICIQRYVSRVAFQQACTTELEVLKQTREPIRSLTDDAKFVSESVLGNEVLVRMARRSGQTDDQAVGQENELDRYQLGFTFSSLFSSRSYLDSISVFNDDSIILQFGNMMTEEDMSRAKAISDLKGKVLWTGAETYLHPLNSKSNGYVVSLYRALNDLYAMKQLGYQRISIKETALHERYASGSDDGSRAFLINQEGDVISADDKSVLGTNISKEYYFGKLFTDSEGYFENGQDVCCFYTLTDPDWCVVRMVPKKLLMSSAKTVSNILVICMLLCISFILICFVLWRKMTLTQKNYKDALLNKEMQLKYLQGQINPHFLYNTLDTIRWMAVRNDQGDIAEQVKALSDVFRYTLNKGDTFTTVAREIEHVRKYMLIQQKRFEDRIEYDIDAGEDCLQLKVPNLILQPLVENAVVHGLEESTEKGRIHIRIYTKENDLYYVVEDNGVGFDEKEIRNKMNNSEQSHEVFALKNIDERLKLMYGDGYGLTFSSVLGVKSIMTIRQKINR